MILYDRVRMLAERQGLSLNDLENRLGFGQNSIYKWKSKEPASNRVREVAKFFNVSTDYLLGLSDNPKINTDDTLLAAHIADDVTEEEMEEIKQFIEFIKSKR
ncbi:helix-turn-helix domain-containing protein [Aerococcus urinaeequi]|uniref:helix-turn-helix domain-containing protein n=1 Tax=Aerococcus urinaeequi TaxID=51665 RepID=UPI003D6B8D17